MTPDPSKDIRRSTRVAVSRGIWVSWRVDGPSSVSRVRDLSLGGVFILTTTVVPPGTTVQMLFSLPEGEMRLQGIVRYAEAEKGVGIEFTRVGTADGARLRELLRRISR